MNEWISVQSSTIARIRWDEQASTLEVEFLGGRVYQYFDVPIGVFETFRSAPSHGEFFHNNIRGHFRYARL